MNSYLLNSERVKPFFRLSAAYVLASCWICGLLLGIFYALGADHDYFLLMRTAVYNRVTIVGLLTTLYLPFLVAALFALVSRPHWILVVCFLKAFSFACCGYGAMSSFDTSGWLIRLLFQFSDCCTIPLLYWFCLRNISGYSSDVRRDFLACNVAILAAGILDFCVISPFLVKLIDF